MSNGFTIRHLTVHAILVFVLSILFTSDGIAQTYRRYTTLKPFALGVVDTLYSMELREKRPLNIYLPEGYHPDSAATYPVIYLLDGSADEDFIHVAGLVQFCNFPWINSLPKSIVIGIANVDRRRDYSFPSSVAEDIKKNPTSGGSQAFIRFLENELQPYVNRNFKTSGDNMILGQSLGGLLATEILYKKPYLFSKYLIVSPSLWWDNQSMFKQPFAPAREPVEVFVAVGKEGKEMVSVAKKLVAQLKKRDGGKHRIRFSYLGNRDHATICHEAVYQAFESFGK